MPMTTRLVPNSGRYCSVCSHASRLAIDAMIKATDCTKAAREFGLEPRSVRRHKANGHMHRPEPAPGSRGWPGARQPVPKPPRVPRRKVGPKRDILDLEAGVQPQEREVLSDGAAAESLPVSPVEVMPPEDDEVRLDSIPAVIRHLEAEARAMRRIRRQAETRADDRVALAATRSGVEATQAARSALLRADQQNRPMLHFVIELHDGTKALDTTFQTDPKRPAADERDPEMRCRNARRGRKGRFARRDDPTADDPVEDRVDDRAEDGRAGGEDEGEEPPRRWPPW